MAKDTKNNANESTNISKSKAKREERRREIEKEKHQKLMAKVAGIGVVAVLVAIIVIALGKNVYLAAIRTTANMDFSAGLTADGKIEGVNVSNAVVLADYAHLSPADDGITATTEEIEEDINNTLSLHQVVDEDTSLKIADGDRVSIDFVGTVDGVEFEGGSSEDYSLTIGSNSFIDDFEQQLIDHSPGEELTIKATFPENYGNEELNGKEASFAVTINGIYVTSELTDAFVKENLAEEGVSTAEEYRALVEKRIYETHLQEYLINYVLDNCTVKSYPSKYVKKVKALIKANDEYMLQFYSMYGGIYDNLWDMRGEDITDELSYEKELTERAKETVKSAMVYQAIFEQAGLTLDMEAVLAEMTEENGEDYVANMKEQYGEAYMAQREMNNAVIEYMMDLYR